VAWDEVSACAEAKEGGLKLIIAGSRTVHPSVTDIDDAIIAWYGVGHGRRIDEIVSGTAGGADVAGEAYAAHHSIRLTRFPADWDKHGKVAGKLRNREMAEYADAALVFWDGMSSGSCDMVTRMVAREKPVYVMPMRAGKR
jgi:hypothetical protein